MKRLASLLLAFAMALSLMPIQVLAADTNASGFTDVSPDAWYYDAVVECARKGIIHGVGGGKFEPDGNLTYAQLATIVCNIIGINVTASGDEVWYEPAMQFCKAHALMATTTNPNDVVTREASADFMYRAFSYCFPNAETQKTIPDIEEVKKIYADSVEHMYNNDIIVGVDDAGTFNPTGTFSRAQFCTVAVRVEPLKTRYEATHASPYASDSANSSQNNDNNNNNPTIVVGTKIPTPYVEKDLYYTGYTQYPKFVNYDSSKMLLTGSSSGRTVGTYYAEFTPKSGYVWEDGTKGTREVQWYILDAVSDTPYFRGSYTYTGNPQSPTETSDWYNYDPSRLRMQVTAQTNAGTYTASFTPINGLTWTDGTTTTRTARWYISPVTYRKPTASQTTFPYTGQSKSLSTTNFNSLYMTKTGDSGTEVGSYTCTIYLNDTTNTAWADGTTAPVVIKWQITNDAKVLAVTKAPTKTSYVSGEKFDSTGMVVELQYVDGSSQVVTDYTVSPETLKYTDTKVLIQKDTFVTSVPVTVTRVVESIEVTTPPNKVNYKAGESFDKAGMIVTATYTDGDTGIVTNYSTSPSSFSWGDTEVTVSYQDKTATTSVTVSRVLQSITVTTLPDKTTYVHGDTFDATGMVVEATYTDGGTEVVTDWSVDADTLSYTDTTVRVTYGSEHYDIPVTVQRVLDSIAITRVPEQVAYTTGSVFRPAGMVVTATYTDGGAAVVTDYQYEPSGALSVTDTEITVTYNDKTATQSIHVTHLTISSVPRQANVLTYNGEQQSPTWVNYNETQMTLSGSVSEVNAGTYTVTFEPTTEYMWSDGTRGPKEVTWTIGKATFFSTINVESYVYGGTITTPSVTNNPGNADVTYYARAGADGMSIAWAELTPTLLHAGTNYCYAVIAESQNYKSLTTQSIAFVVNKAELSGVTVTLGDYVYGSTVPTPVVEGAPSFGTIAYYVQSGTRTLLENVSPTTLNVGTYSIYAVISGMSDYNDYISDMSEFHVTKAQPQLALSVDRADINRDNPTASIEVTRVSSGAISVTSDNSAIAAHITDNTVNVSTAAPLKYAEGTITLTLVETQNYFGDSITIPVTSDFAPEWTSLPEGDPVYFGTFRANGSIIAPTEAPMSVAYTGDLHEYDPEVNYTFGSTDTAANSIKWIKISDTVMIADRNLMCNVSWNDLDMYGWANGTKVEIDGYIYRIRLMTGGASGKENTSEWKSFMENYSDNDLSHWVNCYSWCSTSYAAEPTQKVARGFSGYDYWRNINASYRGPEVGFRPVLEILEAANPEASYEPPVPKDDEDLGYTGLPIELIKNREPGYAYSVNGGSWQDTIPTATEAGTYLIRTRNSDGVEMPAIIVVISKSAPIVTAPTPVEGLVYDGTVKTLLNEGSAVGGTMKYSLDGETWSTDIPQVIDANEVGYGVYYKVSGDANHNDTDAVLLSVPIAKVMPLITPPTLIEGIVYDGESHRLLNLEATSSWGTVEYSLDNENWSTTSPSAINAGTYEIFYRVQGNANVADVDSASLGTVIIKRALVTKPSLGGTYVFNGASQRVTIYNYDDALISMSGFTEATHAGLYGVEVNLLDTVNYQWTDSTDDTFHLIWRIDKLPLPRPVINAEYIYTGFSQTVAIDNFDAATMSKTGDLTRSNVGDYHLTVTLLHPEDYQWDDGTTEPIVLDWSIQRKVLAKPAIISHHTYTGNEQTPSVSNYNSYLIDKSGHTSATNVGNYVISVSLRDVDNYCWDDGTNDQLDLQWTIDKGTPTFILSPSSITLDAAHKTATITVTTNSDGVISAELSDTNIAAVSVEGKIITLTSLNDMPGAPMLSVTLGESANYSGATKTIMVYATNFAPEWLDADTGTSSELNIGFDPITGTFTEVSNTAPALTVTKISDTLLVPTGNLFDDVSWDYLVSQGWTDGKEVTIDGYVYRVRPMMGGLSGGANSEWNTFITETGATTVPDSWTSTVTAGKQVVRGGDSATAWTADNPTGTHGYRPVLEFIGPDSSTGVTYAEPSSPTLTYTGGSTQLVSPTYSGEALPLEYKVGNNPWSTEIPTASDAGTYVVRVRDANGVEGAPVTVIIDKVTPTVTAPSPQTSLTYTGSSQALLTAGSTSDGTVEYSLDGSSWTTNIPSKTDANTTGYTTYYRVIGDKNHYDVDTTSLGATVIDKRSLSKPIASGSYSYNGATQTFSVSNFVSSAMSKSGSLFGTDAGSYTLNVQLSDTANYQWADGTTTVVSLSYTINKATPTFSLSKTSVSLTYTSTSASVSVTTNSTGTVSASSSNTSCCTTSVSGKTVTLSRASNSTNSATVTISVPATTNYKSASATVSVSNTYHSTYTPPADTYTTSWCRICQADTLHVNGHCHALSTHPLSILHEVACTCNCKTDTGALIACGERYYVEEVVGVPEASMWKGDYSEQCSTCAKYGRTCYVVPTGVTQTNGPAE